MERRTTIELMRMLHGELPEAAVENLQDRLQKEPDLRRELEILERRWQGLELPEPEPAPLGFATRVVAGARESADQGFAPAWWSHTLAGKAATALLLAGGIALGAFLASPSAADDWSEYSTAEPSMAESYLQGLEETEDQAWQGSDS